MQAVAAAAHKNSCTVPVVWVNGYSGAMQNFAVRQPGRMVVFAFILISLCICPSIRVFVVLHLQCLYMMTCSRRVLCAHTAALCIGIYIYIYRAALSI